MTQELRNKIYGVVASVGIIAVLLGLVTQTNSDTAQSLLTQAVDLVAQVSALVAVIIAFIKSMPSKVTVIDVPKAAVAEITVTTTKGEVFTPTV